jgi:hypothetical protein
VSGTFGPSGGDQRQQPQLLAGWALGDKVIAGSVLVLAIALFLPWFSASVQIGSGRALSGSADGTQVHGYLWIVFVLVLAILAVLFGRPYLGQLPFTLPGLRQLLLIGTGLILLLTLIAFLAKPSSGGGLGISVSVSWSYGAILGLLAALAAFGAALRLPVSGAAPLTRAQS